MIYISMNNNNNNNYDINKKNNNIKNYNENNYKNNENNNSNNNINNNTENLLNKFLLYIKNDKEDLYTFLKFLFFDIKNVQKKNLNISSNYNTIKNSITNDFKNKINDYLNSNKNIQKTKSLKLIKKVQNNYIKTKKYLIIVKKKLREIELKNNSPNIKFNNIINIKTVGNCLYIDNNFKYKIGELVSRFLFLDIMNNFRNIPILSKDYLNQNKFYRSISDSLITCSEENENKITKDIKDKLHFYYLYHYFYIIGNLFEEKYDFSNIFDKTKVESNLKKLYKKYNINSGAQTKKSQDKKKQDKKKQDKKSKKKYKSANSKFLNEIDSISGGSNNNNENNDIDNNISSTNIKKDDLYKFKNNFLKIMKNTKLNYKIKVDSVETNNIYVIYEGFYKKYLNNYFEKKINGITTDFDFQKIIYEDLPNPICKDDIEAKLKIIDIVNKKSKILDNVKRKKKDSNTTLALDEKKNTIINNIDYKYKFNILQFLRNNLCKDDFNKKNIDLDNFSSILNKSLLLMIKNLIEIKLEIYDEILDKNNLNINSKINETNTNNKNKNLIQLINGTTLDLKNFNQNKNKIIIKKINIVMEEYNKLIKYDRNFDKKVLYYQNILNELISQLQ